MDRMIMACLWAITPSIIGTAVNAQGQAANGAQNSGSAEIIGTVVAAQGAWCDKHDTTCGQLWKMDLVKESSQLVPAVCTTKSCQPVPPGHHFIKPQTVTIRFRWGAKETFDCGKPREAGCEKPLDLSRLVVHEQPKKVLAALWDAVGELADNQPKVYDSFRQAILQSRGSDQKALSDGVVEIRNGGLKVENVLGALPAGEYLLELCPYNDGGEAVCPDKSAPLNYSWNPKKPAVYPASDIHPGMYRLYRWDNSAGVPRRTRHYADILVAGSAKYQALAENFHRVLEATRSWDADDATAPALRRAYLYSLSRP